MKPQKLKELCLNVIKKEETNTGLLLKFYSQPESIGKYYNGFIRTKKGQKSHSELQEARNKLNEIIDFNISDGYLTAESILHILEIIK